MAVAAIFDLDGTLFSGRLWRGIVLHHRTRHVNRHWLYLFLGIHIPMWFLHQRGLFTEQKARSVWAQNMGWMMRGLSEAELRDVSQWVIDEWLAARTRTDVLRVLRGHQADGHTIVLLSGTFEPLAVAIAEWLGADAALGMRLEMRAGRCTGRTLPPLPQGKGKLERLRLYLDETGKDLDLSAAYAYADSHADLPLLEAVGHPVAVYPDLILAQRAAERAWPVIGAVVHE